MEINSSTSVVQNNITALKPNTVEFTRAYAGLGDVYAPFLKGLAHDCASFVNPKKNWNAEIREEFDKTVAKQGIVGKVWDGFKNSIGRKTGSRQVENVIEMNKLGVVSDKDAYNAVYNYNEGQKKALDFVGDFASATLGLAAFGLSIATFGLSAPIGLAVAAGAGAVAKVATKKIDAMSAGREYKTLPYDLATGAIGGFLSPIVSGVGNKVTGGIAKRAGVGTIIKDLKNASKSRGANMLVDLALSPRHKFESGSLPKWLLAFGVGKGFKAVTKTGSAAVLREATFNSFKSPSIYNKSLLITTFAPFAGADIDALREKMEQNEIDFSNEM